MSRDNAVGCWWCFITSALMGGLILYGSESLTRTTPARFADSLYSSKELTVQYKDYAAWQRTHVQDQALQVHADYWKDKLEGLEPLELCYRPPKTRPRGLPRGQRGLHAV